MTCDLCDPEGELSILAELGDRVILAELDFPQTVLQIRLKLVLRAG